MVKKIFLIILILFLSISITNAQDIKTFISNYCYEGSELSTCLQGIYNLGVSIAVVIAFIFFILGAFKNLLSTIPDIKLEGKQQMMNSLIGLAVIFLSGVILYWINPYIFSPTLKIFQVTGYQVPEVSGYTDDDIANHSTSLSTIDVPTRTNEIVLIPNNTYTNIRLANNDTCNGQKNRECVNRCMLPVLEQFDKKLKENNLKVRLTDGYSQGDHSSTAHTRYGTAIDIVPLPKDDKNTWESVCRVIVESKLFNKILYEGLSNDWEELNCGSTKIKRNKFSKTTGKHFHLESCK
jgi:hypothetical protein